MSEQNENPFFKMGQVFKMGQAMFHANEDRAALNARIADLEAIVDKLPKTADGVPVVPGDLVWHPLHTEPHPNVVIAAEGGVDMAGCFVVYTTAIGRDGFVSQTSEAPVSECYSTREAAEQPGEVKGQCQCCGQLAGGVGTHPPADQVLGDLKLCPYCGMEVCPVCLCEGHCCAKPRAAGGTSGGAG